jgi:hypothetical protein
MFWKGKLSSAKHIREIAKIEVLAERVESIPTISKGCRNVSPIRAKCDIDAGLPAILPVGTKLASDDFW